MGLKGFKEFIYENRKSIFSFTELSDEAKEKAVEDYFDQDYLDYEWWEFIYEYFQDQLEDFGVYDIDIRFSGFHSQGDGASFTSEKIESDLFMKKALGIESNKFFGYEDDPKPKESLLGDLSDLGFDEYSREKITPDNFELSIDRISSNSVHENSVSLNVDYDDILEFDEVKEAMEFREFIDGFEDKGQEWVKSKCKEIYNKLYEEYEMLTSEETISQEIINNDIEFDEDGNRVN
jgi:hypothetical protein